MKLAHHLLLFIAVGLMFTACEKDDSKAFDLVGTWQLNEFNVSDSATNDLLPDAETIINQLIAQDCQILEYDFRADGTVFSKTNILLIGTDTENISCPEGEPTTYEGTWQLNGKIVSFSDGSTEESIEIERTSSNKFIISGAELSVENLSGSEFVLVKQ